MMDNVKSLFGKKVDPKEQVREWQRKLRSEVRNCEKQIRDIEREEANVKKSIKEAAKRNDMVSAKSLAKEIVRSRIAVSRLHQNKAQLNSVSMHLNENLAMVRAVGHLSKSTEVMRVMNSLIKAPEMQRTMMDMSREMQKAGVVEEMMGESLDSALDTEDMEQETEEEVDKVLMELAGETAQALPTAKSKGKEKMPGAGVAAAEKPAAQGAEASSVEDDEELDAARSRLENLRA